jgi:hypothetical protein
MSATVQQFVESIPPAEDLRAKLAENLRERDLLKRLLKLAGDREKLQREREGRRDA